MKKIIFAALTILLLASTTVRAEIYQEAALLANATEEQMLVTEQLVGDVYKEVQNGLGYADARVKSNRIIFDAWLSGQTSGYAYGDLVNIANNTIYQYRNMYLRPQFYAENEEKVRYIIADTIKNYRNDVIDYTQARFNARIKIYQSVNPSFNPDVEYTKDACYRDIPVVDSRLFIIARKLLLEVK